MMPYCPKCGKEVKDDAVFCPYCGESLKPQEKVVYRQARDEKGEKNEKDEKDQRGEKAEKNEKAEKPEKLEKREKFEKVEKIEIQEPAYDPRNIIGPDPRLEQVIQAVAGLAKQVSQLADQVEALRKKVSG